MYIAPGIKCEEYQKLNLNDENSRDWNKAIEIFKLRIDARYLEPVDLLVDKDNTRNAIERRYGFCILAISCLLIETLQAFREGVTDSKDKSLNMFVNFLTQRKYFKKHFNKKQARKFFYNFRCGILHQAEVKGDSLLWSVGMLRGKKTDGTPYINRTKIYEFLKKEYNLYCEELKDKSNKKIRENFKTKMDFIAKKIRHR